MLSVAEALKLILAQAMPLPPTVVPLMDAIGCILASDVASDVDSPPHDKSMVDGYAIVAADLATGSAMLRVLEEVTAGDVPRLRVELGAATRIMTGAPLPDGADAVVMIERTQICAGDLSQPGGGDHAANVRIADSPAKPGQNIMRRATSLGRGQIVLTAGRRLRPAEIGVAAEVGRARISIIPPVKVAILATGNELVDAGQTPQPGQIRNSNGPLLMAAARRAGGVAIDLGIARDEPAMLEERISTGLKQADIFVLSGGVSAGVLDLVPGVLANLGVRQVFHKVNLKPGKPIWFGVLRPAQGGCKLVFGLPGNPVSSLVCFELFVRPAMSKSSGQYAAVAGQTAVLSIDFQQRGDRDTYFPATLDRQAIPPRVTPVAWRGSADLCGFSAAGALAIFPAGDRVYRAGESIEVIPLDVAI